MSLSVLLVSCVKKKTPQEIYDEVSSGVVLIQNKYYYAIETEAGEVLYISGVQDGELVGLESDIEEVEPQVAYGTGFFVSARGGIVTNRHVATPAISERVVRDALGRFAQKMNSKFETMRREYERKYAAMEDEKTQCRVFDYVHMNWSIDYSRLRDIEGRQADLKREYQTVVGYQRQLQNLSGGIKVTPHCELSIAYNDTHISRSSDFHSAVCLRSADGVDLALLQLSDKKTPEGRYVFALETERVASLAAARDRLELQQALYLIGYNAGLALAQTQEGIKAQINAGALSQEPNGCQMLYSIPALGGSSGSPVLDEYGQLVAVNFAGVRDTQSFNYGIPLACVLDFLKTGGQSQTSDTYSSTHTEETSPASEVPQTKGLSKGVVRDLLERYYAALISSDYVEASSFFSKRIERFHSRTNLSPDDVISELKAYDTRFRIQRIELQELEQQGDDEYSYSLLFLTLTLETGNTQYYRIDGIVKFSEGKICYLHDRHQRRL